MTGCKGEECPFYVEFWTDIDKIGAGCSHPNFDEMKHSIKFGICPFITDVEGEVCDNCPTPNDANCQNCPRHEDIISPDIRKSGGLQ